MFDIIWDKKAIKELEKLPPLVSKRIVMNVKELKEKFYLKDIKKLKGSMEYRMRVGDYRVIFSLNGNTIWIVKVGHRKEIYKS